MSAKTCPIRELSETIRSAFIYPNEKIKPKPGKSDYEKCLGEKCGFWSRGENGCGLRIANDLPNPVVAGVASVEEV